MEDRLNIEELINAFYSLSKEIEQLRLNERIRVIEEVSSFLQKESDYNEASDLEPEWSNDSSYTYTLITLLGIRICMSIELIRYGYITYNDQVKDDINDLLDQMRDYTRQGSVTNEVIEYTRDWLHTLNEGESLYIDSYLPKKKLLSRGVRNREKNHFDELKGLLYIDTGIACLSYGYDDIGMDLLLSICDESMEKQDAYSHRVFILMVMEELSEKHQSVSVHIGKRYELCFRQLGDIQAAIFFFYYGEALMFVQDNNEALRVTEECLKIRESIAGGEGWFVDIAKHHYASILVSVTNGNEGYDFLKEFVHNIENGKYSDIDKDIVNVVEGHTLYALLMKAHVLFTAEEAEKYFNIYEKICKKVQTHPVVNMRTFYVRKAVYNLNTRNYATSENYWLKALSVSLGEGVVCDTSETAILCDLLMVYYMESDVEHSLNIIQELVNRLNAGELTILEQIILINLIVGIESKSININSCLGKDELKECIEDIFGILQTGVEHGSREERNAVVAIINSMNWLRNRNLLSEEEIREYINCLMWIDSNVLSHHNDGVISATVHSIIAIFMCESQHEDCADSLSRALNDLETVSNPELKADLYVAVAKCYDRLGETSKGLRPIQRFFGEIENHWHEAIRYMNDNRLIQVLLPMQMLITCGYTLLKKHVSINDAYECVIKCKELSSLAGKERNRRVQFGEVDKELLSELHILHDRQQILSSGLDIVNEDNEYKENEIKLREVENRLAEKFDVTNDFIGISVEKVLEHIPDNSVVIEYFQALDYDLLPLHFQQLVDTENGIDHSLFDMYIICKKDGRCTLVRNTINEGSHLIEVANDFLEALQAQASKKAGASQSFGIDNLRDELYDKLLLPAEEYLIDIKNVYIAPDALMVNIPFACLQDMDGEYFGDKHNVIMIECARDFLFGGDTSVPGEGSVIVGNPAFETTIEKNISNDGLPKERMAGLDPEDIKDLPATELEIQRVSKYLNSGYYSGREAIKSTILCSEGKRNLHIATHGYYDFQSEQSSLYSAFLMFAGIKDCMYTGKVKDPYGDGILTADEISRLQLQSVELAVLSACVSGMSDVTVAAGFRGLTGAFSAAGVKYVVSSLWQVDDNATAIFMDKFYEAYTGGATPPEAIQLAKDYVRRVTYKALRDAGWNNLDIHEPDNKKVFQEERFWAGFVCYQCNV